MLFGRFHCAKCGFETAEYYPAGEFDYVCSNCDITSRYNVISAQEAWFTCPICGQYHECSAFNVCILDFQDKEMSYMWWVI